MYFEDTYSIQRTTQTETYDSKSTDDFSLNRNNVYGFKKLAWFGFYSNEVLKSILSEMLLIF